MPIFKVVITAGGTSSRFGKNKLFEKIKNKPVIQYSADVFTNLGLDIVITANETFIDEMKNLFSGYKNIKVVLGGKSRQESVFNGLKAVGECDYVLIHDGARPLISKAVIEKGMAEVIEKKAVVTAVKTTDTIKTVDENKKITSTPDRAFLINVQTPQIFDYELIYNAHKATEGKNLTDDGAIAEHAGYEVYYVEGEYSNIKITNQTDIACAEIFLDTIK